MNREQRTFGLYLAALVKSEKGREKVVVVNGRETHYDGRDLRGGFSKVRFKR